jgi:uncharacterized GH25 family protein
MRITRKIVLLMVISLALTLSASAHYIWIELVPVSTPGKLQEVKIYYGEYNEGVREVKGGRLEELDGIVAWVIDPDGSKTKLPISIEDKYFKTSFTPDKEGSYRIIAVNTVRQVVDWSKSDIGIVKPTYCTTKEFSIGKSSALQNASGESDLIIARADAKNSFLVSFKGQPLVNAKVFFHAPNEWSKELSTDKNGIATFNPLWNGLYIIECIYPEKSPGNFQGKDYQLIRHRATMTFDVQ